MSARSNGAPLWLMRPIINGVIDESRVTLFAGTVQEMGRESRRRHVVTGLHHAAREAQS